MGRKTRLAAALWIVLAFVVWNLVFDRMIVLAGRRFVYAAASAAQSGSRVAQYPRAAAWMDEAINRSFWFAGGAAAVVLLTGFAALALAPRRRSQGDRRCDP